MDEIDFDYEEPSLDPFGGEFSGSDDSENEDEPAVANRDSLQNICHQHLNPVFSLENIYKLKKEFSKRCHKKSGWNFKIGQDSKTKHSSPKNFRRPLVTNVMASQKKC